MVLIITNYMKFQVRCFHHVCTNKISSVVARMYGVSKFGQSSCRPFQKKTRMYGVSFRNMILLVSSHCGSCSVFWNHFFEYLLCVCNRDSCVAAQSIDFGFANLCYFPLNHSFILFLRGLNHIIRRPFVVRPRGPWRDEIWPMAWPKHARNVF